MLLRAPGGGEQAILSTSPARGAAALNHVQLEPQSFSTTTTTTTTNI